MKNKVNLPWECEPNYKQMAPNLTLMLSELNWPQWKAVTPKQSELVGLKVRESELVGLKVRECYIMYDITPNTSTFMQYKVINQI